MLYLSLGTEPSEFRCLPWELIERLDQFPDGPGQMREVWRHYRSMSRRREDRRAADLERRALGDDTAARNELNEILTRRAELSGRTMQEELAKLKERTAEG